MKLNLGCCDDLRAGWVNVDITEPADAIHDLGEPWPWADSTVDEIRAHDIFEHLPDKRHAMNEAWRVLRPGGRLDLSVPTTDGRGAFQDPTHLSFWTPNDLWYYEADNAHRERFARHYGIRAAFRVVTAEEVEVAHQVRYLVAILEAVK